MDKYTYRVRKNDLITYGGGDMSYEVLRDDETVLFRLSTDAPKAQILSELNAQAQEIADLKAENLRLQSEADSQNQVICDVFETLSPINNTITNADAIGWRVSTALYHLKDYTTTD